MYIKVQMEVSWMYYEYILNHLFSYEMIVLFDKNDHQTLNPIILHLYTMVSMIANKLQNSEITIMPATSGT